MKNLHPLHNFHGGRYFITSFNEDYELAYCTSENWYFFRKIGPMSITDWIFVGTRKDDFLQRVIQKISEEHEIKGVRFFTLEEFLDALGGPEHVFSVMLQ